MMEERVGDGSCDPFALRGVKKKKEFQDLSHQVPGA